ncbi:hypothetical protein IE53DRAFT_316075 [Violaceomyces palustris]|uniref:Uncharacterized protein n=1 Tax=Violaceomyces palustris TaxID=1673888 RepID=A0ACD0NWZ3_9BASI|nr:hypothetical protein IE53DRAFT_316075 [Violaceomyces palustris]
MLKSLPLLVLALLLSVSSSQASPQRHLDLEARKKPTLVTPDASGDPDYTPPPVRPHLPLDRLPDARPVQRKRRFVSKLVEDEIERLSSKIKDVALRRIWENCFPNTLDTTVAWADLDQDEKDDRLAFPRAFVITGDIEASWLRDSTNQIKTYLPLLKDAPSPGDPLSKEWKKLYRLALGVLYQQSQFVLTHPLANSFGPPNSAPITHKLNPVMNESKADADWILPPPPGAKGHYRPSPPKSYSRIKGNDGVYLWEVKYEIDSLSNFLGLPGDIYASTGRLDFVENKTWQRAVRLAVDTLRSQQRGSLEEHAAYENAVEAGSEALLPPNLIGRDGEWAERFGSFQGGVYRFQRDARSSTETKADNGWGEPAYRTGLVKSGFRPSDDATTLPFLIPSNAQLAVSLETLSSLLKEADSNTVSSMSDVIENIDSFSSELRSSISEWALSRSRSIPGLSDDQGDVYSYEVDGYGSSYFMDDANVPSLLSLPYLGFLDRSDEVYQRTRRLLLDQRGNKWFFSGKDGKGIGGPHVGWGYAWPMSRIVQILTSVDAEEQYDCLANLRNTTAGTGLMHESFNVNNATDFTRPWFAWVNGLFGEALRHIEDTNPSVLERDF